MKILVTGGCGSIGSELVKQLSHQPKTEIHVIDNNEWALASAVQYQNVYYHLGDFEEFLGKYDYIYHLAAYKHVNLGETNREAFTSNNILKTEKLYRNVLGSVVFFSTDKAVEPISWYGTTKKIGEHLTKERGGIVVRMGNIMHSTGSLIPIWESALAKGMALPITDKRMTRYLSTASVAIEKVLRLLPQAKPGQVIIPSMGEPVKLLDIAESVLKAHNKSMTGENPYPIQIIGKRPGEKIDEKLMWDFEQIVLQTKDGVICQSIEK